LKKAYIYVFRAAVSKDGPYTDEQTKSD